MKPIEPQAKADAHFQGEEWQAMTAKDSPRLQPERQALADALRDMEQYDYEDEYAKALGLLARLTAVGVRLVTREAEAALAEASRPDAAGLREALEAAEYTLNWAVGDDEANGSWREEAQEALEQARAALAAPSSDSPPADFGEQAAAPGQNLPKELAHLAPSSPPLDTERLARALHALIEGPDWKGTSTIEEYAQEIAAAYLTYVAPPGSSVTAGPLPDGGEP